MYHCPGKRRSSNYLIVNRLYAYLQFHLLLSGVLTVIVYDLCLLIELIYPLDLFLIM